MTIVVTGGRDYDNKDHVYRTLDRLHAKKPVTKLVHGGARGADTLAAKWALSRGVLRVAHPVTAEMWERQGKSAGHQRNARMLVLENPKCVVAFPGGKGTANCVATAQARKIPVLQVLEMQPVRWV
jgi:predicted polyphosphate/ATP-dependent NAD kinase